MMLKELEPALELARQLSPDQLAELYGDLEHIRMIVLMRLTSPLPVVVQPAVQRREPDELLNAREAARRLNVCEDYLYRHPELPFVVRMGRSVKFSAQGIETYISNPKIKTTSRESYDQKQPAKPSRFARR